MRLILCSFAATLMVGLAVQAQEEPRLPLDELLDTPISTASKYEQNLSAAAASVTVVTAEDIERYGWTTLDQVLRAVRGFYVSYDRAYSYIGVRGVSQPTDYNVRILLMVNGQPTNGYVFGDALAGTALALDLASVERIEIVRGPGSALFGNHAMLAVIDVITKGADAIDGIGASLLAGSYGKRGASVHAGRTSTNGVGFTLSGYWQETEGTDLYFPEYDSPETNDGIARNRDFDDLHSFSATLKFGNLRVGMITRARKKGVPTAYYDTDFNGDAPSIDRTDILSASYSRSAGVGKQWMVRAWNDRTAYEGRYPYGGVQEIEYSRSHSIGGEGQFRWDLGPNHRMTFGTEYVDVRKAEDRYEADFFNTPFRSISHYFQDEYQPTKTIALTVGLRYDTYSHTGGSVSPRAGIVFTPNDSSTFKLLFGRAFRIPSAYELQWAPDVKPEKVRSLELVWESRLSPVLFATAAVYDLHVDRLIESTDSGSYQNLGAIVSHGAEAGIEYRRPDGIWAQVSYTLQTGNDAEDLPLRNAPRHMFNAGVSTSPWKAMHGGLEAIYESERYTLAGNRTPGYLLVNGTLARNLGAGLKLAVSAENLFDVRYSLPVGPELRPDSIVQDGRSFTVRLSYEN